MSQRPWRPKLEKLSFVVFFGAIAIGLVVTELTNDQQVGIGISIILFVAGLFVLQEYDRRKIAEQKSEIYESMIESQTSDSSNYKKKDNVKSKKNKLEEPLDVKRKPDNITQKKETLSEDINRVIKDSSGFIKCPKCRVKLKLPDGKEGYAMCPDCNHKFIIIS